MTTTTRVETIEGIRYKIHSGERSAQKIEIERAPGTFERMTTAELKQYCAGVVRWVLSNRMLGEVCHKECHEKVVASFVTGDAGV